jgi:hypothetical protein
MNQATSSQTSVGNPRKRKSQKVLRSESPAEFEVDQRLEDDDDNLLSVKYRGNSITETYNNDQKKKRVIDSFLSVEANEHAQHHGIQTFEDSSVDAAQLKFPRKSSTWTPEMVQYFFLPAISLTPNNSLF